MLQNGSYHPITHALEGSCNCHGSRQRVKTQIHTKQNELALLLKLKRGFAIGMDKGSELFDCTRNVGTLQEVPYLLSGYGNRPLSHFCKKTF